MLLSCVLLWHTLFRMDIIRWHPPFSHSTHSSLLPLPHHRPLGRASRLHDRIVYTKESSEKEQEVISSMNQAIWTIKRLQP